MAFKRSGVRSPSAPPCNVQWGHILNIKYWFATLRIPLKKSCLKSHTVKATTRIPVSDIILDEDISPRGRIAKRLGQTRDTIRDHLAKMPELANQPNTDLSRGFTVTHFNVSSPFCAARYLPRYTGSRLQHRLPHILC